MICTILKEEIDCVFMTKQGCNYNGGHCDPVVQACEGCNHIKEIDEDFYCTTSANPVGQVEPGCLQLRHSRGEGSPGCGQSQGEPPQGSQEGSSRSLRPTEPGTFNKI